MRCLSRTRKDQKLCCYITDSSASAEISLGERLGAGRFTDRDCWTRLASWWRDRVRERSKEGCCCTQGGCRVRGPATWAECWVGHVCGAADGIRDVQSRRGHAG